MAYNMNQNYTAHPPSSINSISAFFEEESRKAEQKHTEQQRIYGKTSEYSRAQEINVLEQLLREQHNKNVADCHRYIGNCAMKQHNFNVAVEEFTKAIQIDPTNPVYFCNRAEAFTYTRRFLSAYKDCCEAIKINPQYARAFNRMGIACVNMGQYNDATEAFGNSVLIKSNDHFYSCNLINSQQKFTGIFEALKCRRCIKYIKTLYQQGIGYQCLSLLYQNPCPLHYFANLSNLNLRPPGEYMQPTNSSAFYMADGNNLPGEGNPVFVNFFYSPNQTPAEEVGGFCTPPDLDLDIDPCGPYFLLQ